MKRISVLELSAVSVESCKTPMMKPTPTTCIAISLEIPNREQARGIRSREPPATPEAPQAPIVAMTDKRIAVGTSTTIPSVCAAANVMIVIVIAAPPMLIVAPNGMDTEYISGLSFKRFAKSRLTGMFAAELRVKNA